MIKCVIFDCDGLMFDSEKISIEVRKPHSAFAQSPALFRQNR